MADDGDCHLLFRCNYCGREVREEFVRVLARALGEMFSHGLLTETTVWRGEESIRNNSLSDLGLYKLSLFPRRPLGLTWSYLKENHAVYFIRKKKVIINILFGQWFLRKHLPLPCLLGTR